MSFLTNLISAGPSAGASAAGVLSSIEPYMLLVLVYFFSGAKRRPDQ